MKFIQGDCLEKIDDLESNSIDCVVTSPPYWGLRDYNVSNQIGLEAKLDDHIKVIVKVFRKLKRVLKKEGTVWLNYGDCYATSVNGRKAKDIVNDDRTFRDKPFSTIQGVLKNKDLCLLPARIAIALQEDGWYIRSEIIWHKPNPMPESCKDRPTSAHEKIWLITKSPKYYYDADAIKEPAKWERWGKQTHIKDKIGKAKLSKDRTKEEIQKLGNGKRNKRNVWKVTTKPFKEAHFATFPPDLIEPCIKAGCPENGIVLDPFAGAGTVGLVCKKLNRNAILIELKPDYIEIAKNRINENYNSLQTESSAELFA